MKISLADAWSRWLLLLFVWLVVILFCELAGKVYLADYWADSSRAELWRRAVRLEPGNANYWNKVGRFEQWDFSQGDSHQAVVDFEEATEANPRNEQSWMNLAGAYEATGEMARAQGAFKQAQIDYPISPEVAWRYGNFLLRQGNLSRAFAEFRRALVISPSLTANAVDECWKTTHSVTPIVEEVLPRGSDAYVAALNYFVNQNEVDPALVVWERLTGWKLPFSLQQALPLTNELMSQDRVEDADRVWRQALEATNWPRDPDGNSSLVFNGGFEHDPANGGFDWQEMPVPGASFDFDRAVVHSGARSLRVTFNGSANVNFRHVLEFVKAEPRRYRFAAYLRTEGLSTDSGIRFEVFDPRHLATVDLLTPSLEGTHPWTHVEGEIGAAPDTRILEIVLRRIPTWKLDNKLRGTVWVDDVSLTPLAEAAKANSR